MRTVWCPVPEGCKINPLAMYVIIYALFLINMILIVVENTTVRNQSLHRIAAVKKLTSVYRWQIVVALINVILCIIYVVSQIRGLQSDSNDYDMGMAIADALIGINSIVIIVGRYKPKNTSIKRYIDFWYKEKKEKLEKMRLDGNVPDSFEFKVPTPEEFMDPKWH